MGELGTMIVGLTSTVSQAVNAKKSTRDEKRKRSRKAESKLCCFPRKRERSPHDVDEHFKTDHNFEDQDVRINVTCCSRTWSNSRDQINYVVKQDTLLEKELVDV